MGVSPGRSEHDGVLLGWLPGGVWAGAECWKGRQCPTGCVCGHAGQPWSRQRQSQLTTPDDGWPNDLAHCDSGVPVGAAWRLLWWVWKVHRESLVVGQWWGAMVGGKDDGVMVMVVCVERSDGLLVQPVCVGVLVGQGLAVCGNAECVKRVSALQPAGVRSVSVAQRLESLSGGVRLWLASLAGAWCTQQSQPPGGALWGCDCGCSGACGTHHECGRSHSHVQ